MNLSEAVNIDRGQFFGPGFGRSLRRNATLDEFATVGRQPTSGRKLERLERLEPLTKINKNHRAGTRIGDERNQPDVCRHTMLRLKLLLEYLNRLPIDK